MLPPKRNKNKIIRKQTKDYRYIYIYIHIHPSRAIVFALAFDDFRSGPFSLHSRTMPRRPWGQIVLIFFHLRGHYIWKTSFALHNNTIDYLEVWLFLYLGVYIYVYIYIIHCLLIALDAHMFSHNGCGPRPKKRSGHIRLLGPWYRAHIHYGWTYGHQGQSIDQ